MSAEKKKLRRGDRKDGYLVRDLDSMHAFMPYLLPNRADNEAVMKETLDLTAVLEYIERRNSVETDFKYTLFHVICAAIAKTIALRPLMNRFIAGHRIYDRNVISFSFVIKKQFSDNAGEALCIMKLDTDTDKSPIDQFHNKVRDAVRSVRHEDRTDGTTEKLDVFTKLPRWLLKIVTRVLRRLDYTGRMPDSLMKADPYYSTVFISNLGSIKMSADYHHLVNWGTNSFFVIIGEKKPTPHFEADGSYTMRETLDLGMTIDERIADGLYFANSIKLLRRLIAEPALLDRPITEPID